MASVAEQIAQQQRLVRQRRAQLQQARSAIQQRQSQLPAATSQRALRDRFAGVEGRQQRRQVTRIKTGLGAQEKAIQKYGKELTGVEAQLSAAREQVRAREKSMAEFELGKKKALGNELVYMPSAAEKAGMEYGQKLKQGYQERKAFREGFAEIGGTPIYGGDKFVEIEGKRTFVPAGLIGATKDGQTIGLGNLPTPDLKKLERAGIVKLESDISAFNRFVGRDVKLRDLPAVQLEEISVPSKEVKELSTTQKIIQSQMIIPAAILPPKKIIETAAFVEKKYISPVVRKVQDSPAWQKKVSIPVQQLPSPTGFGFAPRYTKVDMTVGEAVATPAKALRETGGYSAAGWKDIGKKAGRLSRVDAFSPKARAGLAALSWGSQYAAVGAKEAPVILSYGLAPGTTAVSEFAVAGEKYRAVETEADKQKAIRGSYLPLAFGVGSAGAKVVKGTKFITGATVSGREGVAIARELPKGGKFKQIGKTELEKLPFGGKKEVSYFAGGELTAQPGSRVIVKRRYQEALDKMGFKTKPLYEGIPYKDKKGYEKAYQSLIKQGVTPSVARSQLRFVKPKVVKTQVKGLKPGDDLLKVTYETGVGKPKLSIEGFAETTYVPVKAKGVITGKEIKTAGGVVKGEIGVSKAAKIEKDYNIYLTGRQVTKLTKEGRPYSRVKDKLKTTRLEVSGVTSKRTAKDVRELDEVYDFGKLEITKESPKFDVYEVKSKAKAVYPAKKGVEGEAVVAIRTDAPKVVPYKGKGIFVEGLPDKGLKVIPIKYKPTKPIAAKDVKIIPKQEAPVVAKVTLKPTAKPKEEVISEAVTLLGKPPKIPVPKPLPKMVGGEGLVDIKFAGTGAYERTGVAGGKAVGGDIVITDLAPESVRGMTLPSMEDFRTADVGLKVRELDLQGKYAIKTDVKVRQGVLSKQIPQTRLQERFLQPVADISKVRIGLREKITTRMDSRLLTRQATRQVTRQGLITKQVTRQKQPETTRPKEGTTFFVPDKESTIGKLRRLVKKDGEDQAYEVQVRRRGKFVKVGKELLPKGRALQLGVKRTTETLAQTFRLVPKGVTEKEDIIYRVPTDIFTRPKKPTSTIEYVERRRKTLKRGTGEIPSIFKAQKEAKVLFGSNRKKRKKRKQTQGGKSIWGRWF